MAAASVGQRHGACCARRTRFRRRERKSWLTAIAVVSTVHQPPRPRRSSQTEPLIVSHILLSHGGLGRKCRKSAPLCNTGGAQSREPDASSTIDIILHDPHPRCLQRADIRNYSADLLQNLGPEHPAAASGHHPIVLLVIIGRVVRLKVLFSHQAALLRLRAPQRPSPQLRRSLGRPPLSPRPWSPLTHPHPWRLLPSSSC